MSEILSTILFAFSVTGPIFLLVVLGWFFKRAGIIGEGFINQASSLVFKVSLPVFLGMSMVNTDIQTVFDPVTIGNAALSTLLVFILLTMTAHWFVPNRQDRGVYIQGAFRGNLAIVGLAFCANLYGDEGVAKASIVMSILSLVYNILSIYTLTVSLTDKKLNLVLILVGIGKNPLIIGIVVGIAINLLNIPVPDVAMKAGALLSQLTIPVALLCIGAGLSFENLQKGKRVAIASVVAKLIVTPIIIVAIAYLSGFSKIDLGILFLMASTPTAAASYVMVKAMKGDEVLAANIIVFSTVASLFTVSFGLACLKLTDLI